ncbi:helicase-associated domain-containing protein [Brachybacterium sp. DNPG3]
MTAEIRSLADSLRRFGDDRLEALLIARPDLASPVPQGIAPLAARAAGATSARRALDALTLPELHLVEALAVLEDGAALGSPRTSASTAAHRDSPAASPRTAPSTSPRTAPSSSPSASRTASPTAPTPSPAAPSEAGTSPAALAAAVSSDPATISIELERLETLALVWGEDALHLVRPLREGLRAPAGLSPVHRTDPGPAEAAAIVDRARSDERLAPVLDALAWGPSEVTGEGELARALRRTGIVRADDDGVLRIPRSVHLVLRDGRVRRVHIARRPLPEGPELHERFPGSRTAQAVERAFEVLRILRTVRGFDEDPPGVLRRGGLPQRDLKRLAERSGVEVVAMATVLQTAWQAGLIGHDGQEWRPTRDWDAHRGLPAEERWAEIALAWARGHHLAAVVGTPDPTGTTRSLLSDLTRRDGVRTRRGSLLGALLTSPGIAATPESLNASLAWAFPLVPQAIIVEETAALLAEGEVLGLIDDGALTVLGQELVHALDLGVVEADERLAAALRETAPPPVDEVLLDADLTVVIPGRPSERLLTLLDWGEVVSRGGAITLRLSSATLRRAIAAGRDPEELRELLTASSRTPLPQALDYLIQDERRRHGRVHVSRTSTVLTAEPEVLDLLQASSEAAVLTLHRIAPTVAVTSSDAGFALQVARRAGLSPVAVGPDGRSGGPELAHALVGGPIDMDLVTVDGPDLRLPAGEAVARIRAADDGETELTVTDRLLEAIGQGAEIELGIVDGRGGVEVRRAVPLSLEGGRLRARATTATATAEADAEFTVLVHRVTLG